MTNYVEFIQALKTVYPQVISAIGDDAFDADGNPVAYDEAVVQAYIDANAYKAKRAAEYPSIGDQLDALWKGGDAAAEMLATVQAVKAKYPKVTA
jgi:hypothetical protein